MEDKLFCNETYLVECKTGQPLPNTFGNDSLY